MAKPFNANWKDPRGHNLRIYDDVYDSPAFKSLSPIDVVAYLALLRELKKTNNGDLSLTLTRAKVCGISHHNTLASSLRALCAVGLIAVNRKGGCAKGGQKLATLYRFTDIESYAVSAKFLEYVKDTNDWKKVTSIEHGHRLIEAAEIEAKPALKKKINAGHTVTATRTRGDTISQKTRTRGDSRGVQPCHAVSLVENGANPISMRVSEGFGDGVEKPSPRTPRMPSMHYCHTYGDSAQPAEHDDSHGLSSNQTAKAGGHQQNRPIAAKTTMGNMLRRVPHCRSPHHLAAVARLVANQPNL